MLENDYINLIIFLVFACIPICILIIYMITRLIKIVKLSNETEKKLIKLMKFIDKNLKKNEEVSFSLKKIQEKNLNVSRAIRVMLTKYKGETFNTETLKNLTSKVDEYVTERKNNVFDEDSLDTLKLEKDEDLLKEIDEIYSNTTDENGKNIDYVNYSEKKYKTIHNLEKENEIMESMERKTKKKKKVITYIKDRYKDISDGIKSNIKRDNKTFLEENDDLRIENIETNYNKDGENIG